MYKRCWQSFSELFPLLLLGNLQKLKDGVKIDFNIGKLVEVAED